MNPSEELANVESKLLNLDPNDPGYFESYEVYSDVKRYLVTAVGEEALVSQVIVEISSEGETHE